MPGQCQGVLVGRQESLGCPHPPAAEVTFQSQPAALFMASTAPETQPHSSGSLSSSLRTIFPKVEGGGGWELGGGQR